MLSLELENIFLSINLTRPSCPFHLFIFLFLFPELLRVMSDILNFSLSTVLLQYFVFYSFLCEETKSSPFYPGSDLTMTVASPLLEDGLILITRPHSSLLRHTWSCRHQHQEHTEIMIKWEKTMSCTTHEIANISFLSNYEWLLFLYQLQCDSCSNMTFL